MARYALVIDGNVVGVPIDLDVDLKDAFHPDIAKSYMLCGPDVAEFWRFDGASFSAPDAPAMPPPTEEQARRECARRILERASEPTQANLNAYMNVLSLKPSLSNSEQADAAAFALAVQWIADMRAKWKALFSAADVNFRDDAKWPPCPQAAIDLAARF